MTSWKKNLAVVWLSQFLSIAGFAFAMPFAPFYMQELGVTDPVKLQMWVAVQAAAAPLSLAVFSPIWGAVGDRYGRRLMLLRANLGAVILLCLMGTVSTATQFLALRCVQGALTGTMVSAQTMVSARTPNHRSGLAMGALSSAVYSGFMAGAFLGGTVGDAYGYRCAFFVAGGVLLVSVLLILFGTTEVTDRKGPQAKNTGRVPHAGFAILRAMFPVFVLIGVMSMVRRFDSPFLPLLVQDIHGSVSGAGFRAGGLFAVAGIAGLLGGPLFGHLADRRDVVSLVRLAAIGGGLVMFPQGWVRTFGVLFVMRFALAFFLAGLDPIVQAWLSRTTPARSRGFVFGWMTTARSLGAAIGPMCAGGVAAVAGVREIFRVAGVLLLIFSLAAAPLFARCRAAEEKAESV